MEILLGFIFVIELLVTIIVSFVSGMEEDPFYPVRTVWNNTEGELNKAGRIICATFVAIVCAPAILFVGMIYAIIYIIAAFCGAFCYIFRVREKKEK